jgi:hypothetical protein
VFTYLFEGLNKTIKENQAKKEQEIKELGIPSHSFFKASWTATSSALPQSPEHGEPFPPSDVTDA